MNECVSYDDAGALVDENDPYAACRGTPDQYDASNDPVKHAATDAHACKLDADWFATAERFEAVEGDEHQRGLVACRSGAWGSPSATPSTSPSGARRDRISGCRRRSTW
jgi:hypothetical protein